MPDVRKHARLMMGAKPGRRSVVRARHWAGREAALPRGLQRTPSSDLYAYRSMMTGGGSARIRFFVWRPTASRPSSPRETKKSRRPISFWEMKSKKTGPATERTIRHAILVSRSALLALVPSPVSQSFIALPVVLRRAVRHPPKSSLGERMSPAELSRSFAYYLQCPQRKTDFPWAPIHADAERQPWACWPPRRRASGDPALVSQVA
ncbi:hypothetical protein B0T18DRAFT_117531 [Schizothecium vesticola]|uniref:Uncharacterized protein n=1 Tax=Schizothecium vesticola TaxID=314040 RepID=A0AA40F2A0_9PEZI|nr:hypothetical protein B0T18DRAFT_117531 [Schizothecium vesticola]